MATNLILAHSKFLTRRNLWKDKTARVVIETVPEKQYFESRCILKKTFQRNLPEVVNTNPVNLQKFFPIFQPPWIEAMVSTGIPK